MTPNIIASPTGVLFEDDAEEVDTASIRLKEQQAESQSKSAGAAANGDASAQGGEKPRPIKPVWRNIALFAYLHMAALYGFYLIFTSARIYTTMWAFFLYICSGLGITAGAHRLWAHRSYKAKMPLRILLTAFNTLAFQDAVVDWARDHRVHHKYSETNADPHNAKRGFFFSHVGWLLCRKHPDVKSKGQGIDLSDLHADPVLKFQKRYYLILMPLTCFAMPAFVPWYFWGETLKNGWFVATLTRYCLGLNATWLVNSAAHMFGHKPYDKYISPSENKSVAIMALGEGWHNYHHTFPWDYKTAELGKYSMNITTAFIDFFAWLGWAYDLKTVPSDLVRRRVDRTGDGTHELWGWGDADQTQEERDAAVILARDTNDTSAKATKAH